MKSQWKVAREPGLDGLRGLAIWLVMAAHIGLPVPGGGTVGVTIFFVLSGYLVMSALLIVDGITPRGIYAFLLRRAFRILPALLVLVAVITAWDSRAVGVPEWRNAFYAVTLQANIVRARGDLLGHMGHIWSLALEEQFYLCLPALALLLTYLGFRRALLKALMAICIGSTVLRLAALASDVEISFIEFSPIMRCDALAAGCCLAIRLAEGRPLTPQRPPSATCYVMLGAIVLFACVSGPTLQFAALISATVFISCALISLIKSGAIIKLESVWFTGPGRISYGLFLWHVPIISLIQEQTQLPLLMKTVVVLALSFFVASSSYVLLERPLMSVGRTLASEAIRNRAEP